jgi:hypothetical protein
MTFSTTLFDLGDRDEIIINLANSILPDVHLTPVFANLSLSTNLLNVCTPSH